jgi:hypothetical protein
MVTYTPVESVLDSRDLQNLCGGDGWMELLLSNPSQSLVSNVKTRWAALQIGQFSMPVTINDTEYDNSYVCSPYTGCVLYPRSEVAKLDNRFARAAILCLVNAMGPALRFGKINQVVCVNNWMLSTNLYPSSFDGKNASAITQAITQESPEHAIVFRSLNQVNHGALIQNLEAAGYLMAPSRQVYLFDRSKVDFMRKRDSRNDLQLLQQTRYTVVPHEQLTEQDVPQIEHLYRLLYIDKYSHHNPQFTTKMIEAMRRGRFLTMWGLRNESGTLDGIFGAFFRDGVMTVPLVGYDTGLPQQLGLYRLLTAVIMREAVERGVLLNASSGAGGFKRLRGGQACMEYTAVYCQHLPWQRRVIWNMLAGILKHVGAPILRKYEL